MGQRRGKPVSLPWMWPHALPGCETLQRVQDPGRPGLKTDSPVIFDLKAGSPGMSAGNVPVAGDFNGWARVVAGGDSRQGETRGWLANCLDRPSNQSTDAVGKAASCSISYRLEQREAEPVVEDGVEHLLGMILAPQYILF